MGRPEAQNDHEHQANQAPAANHQPSELALHDVPQPQQQPAESLPPPFNPSNIIGRRDHEADDDHPECQANINAMHDIQTHHQQAIQQPHQDHLVQLTPPNPSLSSGISRSDHHDQEYQANQAINYQTDHRQQPQPLNVVQWPPPNPHSTDLILHQYRWPHHNFNARPPPSPSTYYPPHHHPRHHHQASASESYYSTPQVLFPPPAAYQFVPHHQSGYYNSTAAVVARTQLPPALHYNTYVAEKGIPIQNFQYLPMQLRQPVGIDATWKTGLFECFQDPANTIMTLFFPCCTFGQIAEIVDNGSTSCAINTIIYMLISVCILVPCVLSCTYRKRLRNKFDLPEGPAPDCITHFLCECCALCQEHRELQLRGLDPSLGWVGNMENIQRLHEKREAATVPPMTQRMIGY